LGDADRLGVKKIRRGGKREKMVYKTASYKKGNIRIIRGKKGHSGEPQEEAA